MKKVLLVMCAVSLAFAADAMADVNVVQGPSAPTYANTLNFDEPGQATGVLPNNYWAGIGIDILEAGDSFPIVDDFSGPFPWINDGNAFFGNFGVFITFANDVTGFSAQVWDNSGPPTFFGGGLGGVASLNGVDVGGVTALVEPAWGGLPGDGEWFDVSTTGGSVFNEVRILGFSFSPTTYVDNLSWTNAVVPEPGSFGLMFIAAAALAVRRRK